MNETLTFGGFRVLDDVSLLLLVLVTPMTSLEGIFEVWFPFFLMIILGWGCFLFVFSKLGPHVNLLIVSHYNLKHKDKCQMPCDLSVTPCPASWQIYWAQPEYTIGKARHSWIFPQISSRFSSFGRNLKTTITTKQ